MKKIQSLNFPLALAFAMTSTVVSAQSSCDVDAINTPVVGETINNIRFEPNRDGGSGHEITSNGDRVIFWLHGLGGDEFSWERAANATQAQISPIFPARKAICLRPHYGQWDLSNAGVDLQNYLIGNDLFTTNGNPFVNNFLIAHSQGGPVSRKLDMMYTNGTFATTDRRIGGIVTFGSPHRGAQIINNIPLLQTFSAEACSDILAGPVVEKVENTFLLQFFVGAETAQKVADEMCNFFGNSLVPYVFKDALHPITKDYAVGASEIANLTAFQNSPACTTPMVAFYGEEDDPIFWRLMYSFSVDDINSHSAFTADPDQQLVSQADENRAKYYAKREMAHATILYDLGQYCTPWRQFFEPVGCGIYQYYLDHDIEKHEKLYWAWDKGYQWWLHADDNWRVFIGADQYITSTMTVPELFCKCQLNNSGHITNLTDEQVNSSTDCQNLENSLGMDFGGAHTNVRCHTYTRNVTGLFTIFNHQTSDGVVVSSSAGGLLHRQNWPMKGSNHGQIKNDTNTKLRLTDLFNGLYDPYFATAPR
jgi:pimeloyl-ACP methyl ester carboxylesterase